jgi:hypothetical protein
MRAEWSMSEEELRGIILENLWTHRRKTIMFDHALKDLLIPIETKKSILKQLERGGLIRYTFEADTGLGSGDMTFKGIEVAEGTATKNDVAGFGDVLVELQPGAGAAQQRGELALADLHRLALQVLPVELGGVAIDAHDAPSCRRARR